MCWRYYDCYYLLTNFTYFLSHCECKESLVSACQISLSPSVSLWSQMILIAHLINCIKRTVRSHWSTRKETPIFYVGSYLLLVHANTTSDFPLYMNNGVNTELNYSDGQKKGRWQIFDLEIRPFLNCTLCYPTKSKCVKQHMRLITREWRLKLW